ncbi:MAG: T9SS type A sorting domain-containing protein [Luteibaculaceae bacterium]
MASLFCALGTSAQTLRVVAPNTADPLSGPPNNNHFIYINPSVSQKNKLFLFFPGTFAIPFNYREILKHAANLGYHAIGLTYPNGVAINQICLTTTDTTCHSRARLEIFDGIDRHFDISVDEHNSIARRTRKLLEYLDTNFPAEHWGQFLVGNEVDWSKIILSGHSQGGGHAGIISKIHSVERVVMFAAMDWIGPLNRNADWITWEGETPTEKYFGFTHELDEFVDFNTLQLTWANFGMDNFGALVLTDTIGFPFNNSHQLSTLLVPANDPSKFHGSVVADAYTPMLGSTPVLAPVWTYLIEGNDFTLSVNHNLVQSAIDYFPNPVKSVLHINGLENVSCYFLLYNMQGQVVKKGQLSDNRIDLLSLEKGLYLLNLTGTGINHTLRLIKE